MRLLEDPLVDVGLNADLVVGLADFALPVAGWFVALSSPRLIRNPLCSRSITFSSDGHFDADGIERLDS